ncbi:MAG: phosphatidylserine decarboxylase family protein [Bacteroidetes bacterium]|nr:phosphatidylserine decarboxylase family protein [Bacteroidota bacterium]MCH8941777.1 phosphatidylserine decarboxylase family protein [Bacteroidota bacterium]
MITKYGYSTLFTLLIICIIIITTGIFFTSGLLKILIIIFSTFLVLFSLNFFRDPERNTPQADNIVVSPADGRVLFVKKINVNKYVNEEGTQISIFMSPLNVHVNRIPINGKIEFIEYIKGKYIAAFEDKASEENERSEFGIKSKYGKVFFTQVAGFVARRIVYTLKIGDDVTMGNRFGMIKFGSRVDVVVNNKWEAKVKKDDIVKAGETILFEHPGK